MYPEFPTLSLHDGNTLYLMIRRNVCAWDRWVIAVDLANMNLQDVAHYRRECATSLKFRRSNISNHLNMGQSSSPGWRKRPGEEEVLESSRKKQFVLLSMMDDMVSSWVGEQGQHQDAETIKRAQYGDDMDLDSWT
jgi:hypothetical protein